MPAKKLHTHRVHCILREGRRGAGRWVETGYATTVADNGKDFRLYLSLLPVSGFDGHIFLEPIDTPPGDNNRPDPDEDDDEMQPPADDTPALH